MRKKSEKSKNNRTDVAYGVALAGIVSAISLLFVWLGVVSGFATLSCFAIAGIALMVPISKKFYISSIFAYAVSAGLSFLIVGDIVGVIGYIVYFGPMSILSAILIEKKVKLYFAIPLKVLLINAILAGLYFGLGTLVVSSAVLYELHYALIALIGTIVLIAIDFVLQGVYKFIIPRVSRVLRGRRQAGAEPSADSEVTNASFDTESDTDDDCIFEEFSVAKSKSKDQENTDQFNAENACNRDVQGGKLSDSKSQNKIKSLEEELSDLD